MCREERVVLKDHPDPALAGGQVLDRTAIDADRARGEALEPRQHHQDRGLARPGRPQQGDELTLADREIEVFDDQGAAVIALADPLELDARVAVGAPGGGVLVVVVIRHRDHDGRLPRDIGEEVERQRPPIPGASTREPGPKARSAAFEAAPITCCTKGSAMPVRAAG